MRRTPPIDYALLFAVMILLVFGLIMITSIGVPKSIDLSKPAEVLFPSCGVDGVDCYFLLKRHAARLGMGLLALILASYIPYRFWKKIAIPAFIFCVVLLFSVLVIGTSNNTAAKSWIVVSQNSLQPAEIAKLILIFYLAAWMERKGKEIGDFKNGFLSFCMVAGLIILPIILQPDLGSTLVIAAIAAVIYFVAGARLRHIALGMAVVLVFASIVIPSRDYLWYRFSAFFNPSLENCQPADADGEITRNYCWQSEQANVAVGSGGLWGRGLTQGIQKSYWLPQATDDFIFAASAEELGFFRIILVVLAYLLIALRGYAIAARAPDRFAQLMAVGITTWVTVQAFINVSVNIGLMPVTGITLPFVSYGGSSMLATLIGVGVLLNISRYSFSYATSSSGRRNRGAYPALHRGYRRA